jgi:hypothetical protein
MNIEHCDCLSWVSRKGESHKQDGEMLSAQHCCDASTASGDPAMAFGLSLDMNGQRPIPGKSGRRMRSADDARDSRVPLLTANIQPFD